MLPPLCQTLFTRLEPNHYGDKRLGTPDTSQAVKASKSPKSLQCGFAVVPFNY